jgi:hypothetical protein
MKNRLAVAATFSLIALLMAAFGGVANAQC